MTKNKSGFSRILPYLLAITQWGIEVLCKVDKLYFEYEGLPVWSVISKAIALVFLVVFWNLAFHTVREIKAGNKNAKRFAELFLAAAVIRTVYLLMIWPGTWAHDDLRLAQYIYTYDVNKTSWHHILSGIFLSTLLQILPFNGGVIWLQNLICSLFSAFIIVKVENRFDLKKLKNKYLDIFVKQIPFLLPPILRYQMSGYRMGIYVIIEAAFLTMVICDDTEIFKKSFMYKLGFAACGMLTLAWRSESVVYLPFVIVWLIYALVKEHCKNWKPLLLTSVLLFGSYFTIQKIQAEIEGDNTYEIMSTLRPGVALIQEANAHGDTKEFDKIDKVLKMRRVLNNPEMSGEVQYWLFGDYIREGYSRKEYTDYLVSLVKLGLKYPGCMLAERWNVFMEAANNLGTTHNGVIESSNLYGEFDEYMDIDCKPFFASENNWILNKPINEKLRTTLIRWQIFLKSDDTFSILYVLFWNLALPILAIFCAWIETIKNKKWTFFIMLTGVLCKIPVIFITEPERWFMYWLSLYCVGTILMFFELFEKNN